MGNSFGKLFKLTTFGESHGKALGAILEGCPAGLEVDDESRIGVFYYPLGKILQIQDSNPKNALNGSSALHIVSVGGVDHYVIS